MKVIHVVRQFHPSVGGMEEVVLNIARHHRELRGDQVEVVTLDRLFTGSAEPLPHSDIHCGIPVKRIAYRGSTRYPLAPAVLGAIRGADLLHVHGVDFFYDFLALTRPLHGIAMVASTHGGFFHTAYASRLKRLWFQTITRASSLGYRRIIATSENDGRMFSQVVAPGRLRVIENGVDVEKFAGRGSTEPGRTLVYFGRWSVNKGLLESLDLLRELRRLDARWRLVIAGREYDFGKDDLQRAVAERGLQEQVEFCVAPSQDELAQLLEQAQFFLCLSRHEGFGIAAVEAMSAGLLPVLSDIPPFARLEKESGLGVLLDPADPRDGARRLEQAVGEPSDHARRRQQAMAQASRYHWRHAAQLYLDEYDAALSESRGGHR